MSTDQSTRCLARRNALALLILTVIFAFRVVAQLVQAWHPLRFLPPFEAWHSGALPYSWLVGTQVVIMAMCLRIVWKLLNNTLGNEYILYHVMWQSGFYKKLELYFVN